MSLESLLGKIYEVSVSSNETSKYLIQTNSVIAVILIGKEVGVSLVI